MNQVVPTQHPAVVLRSNYTHLRALLAVAMIAVVGLSGAVVILATQDEASTPRVGSPAVAQATPSVNGPDESLRGLSASGAASQATPSVNGPDESLRGLSASGATSPEPRSAPWNHVR